jgi:hypothetical protein
VGKQLLQDEGVRQGLHVLHVCRWVYANVCACVRYVCVRACECAYVCVCICMCLCLVCTFGCRWVYAYAYVHVCVCASVRKFEVVSQTSSGTSCLWVGVDIWTRSVWVCMYVVGRGEQYTHINHRQSSTDCVGGTRWLGMKRTRNIRCLKSLHFYIKA